MNPRHRSVNGNGLLDGAKEREKPGREALGFIKVTIAHLLHARSAARARSRRRLSGDVIVGMFAELAELRKLVAEIPQPARAKLSNHSGVVGTAARGYPAEIGHPHCGREVAGVVQTPDAGSSGCLVSSSRA